MGKKTICLFLVVVLLLGGLFVLPGCQVAPRYEVDSYEQIKQDLAEHQPEIIYPDISRYEQSGVLAYWVHLYPGDRRMKNGYIVGSDYSFREADVDSSFSIVSVEAKSIEYYYDERNPCPPLVPSMTYRAVSVEYYERETTDWYISQDRLGEGEGYLYPLGTREGGIECLFAVNGYRYQIVIGVVMTPDDLKDKSYEAWMDAAREEVYLIIDSILDQSEIQGGTAS
ncbi:MAG: hypothetical protein LBS98_06850 [Coriobacteriales bacterium]|jgi:hypothetical protein|nr:hypothetical protein [Coriobacteriales bacterium]